MTAASPPPGPRGATVSRAARAFTLALGCFASVAYIARAVGDVDPSAADDRLWYLGLGGVFLGLFVLAVLRPPSTGWQAHALLMLQCLLAWRLLAIEPDRDWMTNFFLLLAAEAAVLFVGRTVWYWVAALAALTVGPLMIYQEPLPGLSLTLGSVALEIVVAASLVLLRELEEARRRSQQVLEELQEAHGRLQDYAARAGELAAAEERERVARDLNESVARRVAAILAAAAAARQALVPPTAQDAGEAPADHGGEASPDAAAPLVAALQTETQAALAQMRGLIAELRPAARDAQAPPAEAG